MHNNASPPLPLREIDVNNSPLSCLVVKLAAVSPLRRRQLSDFEAAPPVRMSSDQERLQLPAELHKQTGRCLRSLLYRLLIFFHEKRPFSSVFSALNDKQKSPALQNNRHCQQKQRFVYLRFSSRFFFYGEKFDSGFNSSALLQKINKQSRTIMLLYL